MRRRKPQTIEVGGFRWFIQPPLADPARERWLLDIAEIHVSVTDYGQDDPRQSYYKGWRIVVGAPTKDEFEGRDEAMIAAREIIKSEVLHRGADLRMFAERGLDITRSTERLRYAVEACRRAGIELT